MHSARGQVSGSGASMRSRSASVVAQLRIVSDWYADGARSAAQRQRSSKEPDRASGPAAGSLRHALGATTRRRM